MQIQSINATQYSKKQNFGAHFNFTAVGSKFVSELATCMRKESLDKEGLLAHRIKRQDAVKSIDKLLDSDMVITLNKFENNRYHGVLSKGQYQADFSFRNCINEEGDGLPLDQLTLMYRALGDAAINIKKSGKSFFDAMNDYLPLK